MNLQSNSITYITTSETKKLLASMHDHKKQIELRNFNNQLKIESMLLLLDAVEVYQNFEKVDNLFKSQGPILGLLLFDSKNVINSLFSELIQHLHKKQISKKIVVINDNKIAKEILRRFEHAYKVKAPSELILDAKLFDRKLKVISCDFKSFEVDANNIKCLRNLSDNQLQNFKIDSHGSYIYWEEPDIHLDLTSFKAASDPEFKRNLIEQSLAKNKEFGILMKKFRELNNVRQNEFKGISERQIRRYENGEQYPTYKNLEKISKKYEMSVQEYLEAIEK